MTNADQRAVLRRNALPIAAILPAVGGLLFLSGFLDRYLQRADMTVAGWWWCLLALFVVRASSVPQQLAPIALAAGAVLTGPWVLPAWLAWLAVHRTVWRVVLPTVLCGMVIWLRPLELVGDGVVQTAWIVCWGWLLSTACLQPLRGQRSVSGDSGAVYLLMAMIGLRIGALTDGWWVFNLALLTAAAPLAMAAASRSTRVRTRRARRRLQIAALWALIVMCVAAGSEAALTVGLSLCGMVVWWSLRDEEPGLNRAEWFIVGLISWAGAAALIAARLPALLPVWLAVWWWLTESARRCGAAALRLSGRASFGWLGIVLLPWLIDRLAAAAAALSVQSAPFGTIRGVAGSGLIVFDSAAQQLAALPLLTLIGGAALIWALLTFLVPREPAND